MKNHGKMEIFCSFFFFSNFLVYNKYLRNLQNCKNDLKF